MSQHFLRFASWNIEGLSGKLDDKNFVSNLNKFDIVSLVETWSPYTSSNIQLDGYSFLKCTKTVSKNLRRSLGGITMFVKLTLRKGIKFLDKESSKEFVWYKMDKTFFKLKHDIFICTVYIPPQNSSRELRLNIDHFEKLQNNIYKFPNKGSIILCGDFNARIETVEDFIGNKHLEDDIFAPFSFNQ